MKLITFPVGKKRFYIHTITFLLPIGRLRNCTDVSYTKKISSPSEMDMMKISASFTPWDGRPWVCMCLLGCQLRG